MIESCVLKSYALLEQMCLGNLTDSLMLELFEFTLELPFRLNGANLDEGSKYSVVPGE